MPTFENTDVMDTYLFLKISKTNEKRNRKSECDKPIIIKEIVLVIKHTYSLDDLITRFYQPFKV